MEEPVGREAEEARRRQAAIPGGQDLAGRPDQQVGIPDGGHAIFGHGMDLDLGLARPVEDGRHPP
jgi:hypothetical protein